VTGSQAKASFSQRALSYFKGTSQLFSNIQVAPGVFNKNLKQFMNLSEQETEEMENMDE